MKRSGKRVLPRSSLAAIVLDSSRTPSARSQLRAVRALPSNGIGATVLEGDEPGRRLWVAAAAAALLYGGTYAVLTHADLQERPNAREASPQRPPLLVEPMVELNQPAAEPPEQKTEPRVAAPEPRARAPAKAPGPFAPTNASVPAAQAGQVVAASADAQTVDFTTFDLTTGDGPSYAGGVTASSGSNANAVSNAVPAGNAAPGSRGGVSASRLRPVQLDAREWDCPWPRAAESLGVDEQTVVLRVVVRPDGSVASARLAGDPGHGFGEAALACARRSTLISARGPDGRATTSESPPIRVHFTRRRSP